MPFLASLAFSSLELGLTTLVLLAFCLNSDAMDVILEAVRVSNQIFTNPYYYYNS